MQYPQQQGWNNPAYPPSTGAGYPAPGAPHAGAWGAHPPAAYPGGGGGYGGYHHASGYPGGAGMYPHQQPGMYPPAGMYPGAGVPQGGYPAGHPGAYPQGGMYPGAGVPPQAQSKNYVELKPTVNPVEAMFGKKDPNPDPNANRPRRVSNPPPVQPTPQELKPQPKRAPNYNIDLSAESEGTPGLGIPGTPGAHAAKPAASTSQAGSTPPTGSLLGPTGGIGPATGSGSLAGAPGLPGAYPAPGAGAHGQFPGAHPGQFPPAGAHPGQFPPAGAHAGAHPGQFPPGGAPKQGGPTGGPAQGLHGAQYPPGGIPGQYPGAPGQYPPAGYGYPPSAGAYGGYVVPKQGGSFFLPPSSTSGAAPAAFPNHAAGGTPLAGFSSNPAVPSSPVVPPSPSSAGAFQHGLLGNTPSHSLLPQTGPSALHQSAPLQPATLQPSPHLHSTPGAPLQPGAALPGAPLQPAARSNSIPVLTPGAAGLAFQPSPPRTPLQPTASTSAASPMVFSQFHSAGSPSTDDWAGADFGSSAVGSGDDFGFSDFQGASQSPAKSPTPQSPQKEKDFFGFDEPKQSSPARLNKQKSIIDFDQPSEIAPSPRLSRSNKHLKPQESEQNFFGTPVANVRHNNTNLVFDEPEPAVGAAVESVTSFMDPVAPVAEPVQSSPEPPKKPVNALESMMENSLFKVTHKPPPMAKAAAQVQPSTQQKPAAQPQQSKSSASKFDWSSTNYRDIFGESDQPVPTVNPLAAQEQFEGFVSASDTAGDFEFGAFEGSSSSDPFASSPPSAFGSEQTFHSHGAPAFSAQPSPFGSESGFGASPLFPEDTTFGAHASPHVLQPKFSQSHQPDEQFTFPSHSSPTLAPAAFPAPSLKPASPTPTAPTFASESFSSELFSSNQLSANENFGFASTPSFDSPFNQQAQQPSPKVHAPSPIPTSYPDSEPAFGMFPRRSSIPPTPANSVVKTEEASPFGDNTEFGGSFFGSGSNSAGIPATPANSVVGPPRPSEPVHVESEPAFGDFSASNSDAPAFGDFFGQSKGSAPPTPANTVVQSDRQSTAIPAESFGTVYSENSRSTVPPFTQSDPTFESFVTKSTSVPPTPANSVDRDAKTNNNNNNNFFSDPFGTGSSNNLKPASTTSTPYDTFLTKPLNTFNYSPAPSPSSSVIAPESSSKPNGDWGLTSAASDYEFGSPFGDATTPATRAPPSTSPVSSVTNTFSPTGDPQSAFDTSFGSAPVFPVADSFGQAKISNDSEFGNFSAFDNTAFGADNSEFGAFSSASEFGTASDFGTFTTDSDFGNSGFGDFSSPQSSTFPPAASSASLPSLFKSLVDQERLHEAAQCQTHIKNDTQPSQQELAAWAAPNSSHSTIAQLKQRLLSHTSQEKVVKAFAQYEKQSLSAMATVNLDAAIESQKAARQFVTAIIEWQEKWDKQLSCCVSEVATAHGLATDIRTSSGLGGWDSEKEIFAQTKWTTYFTALVEVYRVACRLTAAAQHFHVPASPHSAKLAASWSVLTALLKVDNIDIDYSDHWDNAGHTQVECALCHVPVKDEPSAPWDGATYHVSCANVWANRVSAVPPHVK